MPIDTEFVTKILHMHSYATALALADALGEVQAVLMNDYAEKLIILANTLRLNINSIKEYTSSLKNAELVGEAEVKEGK